MSEFVGDSRRRERFVYSHVRLVATETEADVTRLRWALSAPGGVVVQIAMRPAEPPECDSAPAQGGRGLPTPKVPLIKRP